MSDFRPDGALRPDAPCLCGFGPAYAECCGRFHAAEGTAAPTAEALMRSRYTAFAVGDAAYLLRTWHPDTRPRSLTLDPDVQWTRLTIVATTGGGLLEQTGTVEFVAQYRTRGPDGSLHRGRQHEDSRFVRIDGAWVYQGTA
ncbi:YchJ family protein [Tomitella gaofuii]|uniref:YchJ family protein n=1 Tax=Tomitella gaofuii TaxID=2760083 RepID=UPI0015F8B30C|nr:YchJ family metal-binding protein [Tomitella gaofuii]